jgi:hypothetical protein
VKPTQLVIRRLHGRNVVVALYPPAVVHDYRAPEYEPVGLPLSPGGTWLSAEAQR